MKSTIMFAKSNTVCESHFHVKAEQCEPYFLRKKICLQ